MHEVYSFFYVNIDLAVKNYEERTGITTGIVLQPKTLQRFVAYLTSSGLDESKYVTTLIHRKDVGTEQVKGFWFQTTVRISSWVLTTPVDTPESQKYDVTKRRNLFHRQRGTEPPPAPHTRVSVTDVRPDADDGGAGAWRRRRSI